MKKIKKLLVLNIIILIFGLGACGKTPSTNNIESIPAIHISLKSTSRVYDKTSLAFSEDDMIIEEGYTLVSTRYTTSGSNEFIETPVNAGDYDIYFTLKKGEEESNEMIKYTIKKRQLFYGQICRLSNVIDNPKVGLGTTYYNGTTYPEINKIEEDKVAISYSWSSKEVGGYGINPELSGQDAGNYIIEFTEECRPVIVEG